jgi:polysaccharide chain length determinant protein (PEP-CTERM system associated)
MLPGKKYTPQDFLAIASRYAWLIVGPVLVFAVLAFGVSLKIPNKYRSETLVLVVPQRVPETYVKATVTSRIEDRVRSIREQILSRSRLERIIEEFNLYPREREKLLMEDVIDIMRRNVTTRVETGRTDAFSVAYTSNSATLAQKVTERLAGLFNEENMRDREVLAESTNQFLQTQLDEARQRLGEQEKLVERFRVQHAGELPDQVNSNVQAIQNAELQLQTLTQSLNSERERRVLLERQLADAAIAPEPAAVVIAGAPPAPTTAQQLEAAQAAVRTLETRVTSEHPDLVMARAAVARLQRQLDGERPGTTSARPPTSAEMARTARVADFRNQVDAMVRQIIQKEGEERRLRSVVAAYRVRVEAAPTRETELVALTRDYETLQHQYRTLLEKFEDSKIAANLERRQIGEQFRILDPARIAERPDSPNRRLITAGGGALGLLLGVGLIALLEFRDRTLRTPDEVAQVLSLDIVAVIPSLGGMRRRWHQRHRLLLAGGTMLFALVVGAGVHAWRAGLLPILGSGR